MSDTRQFSPKVSELSGRKFMQVVVPEGVPLSIELPGLGERMAAFAIDLMVCLVGLVLVFLIAGWMRPALVGDFLLLAFFLLRNCYFIGTEIAMGGATPGKRMLRLSVIKRVGGTLDLGAILARNIMREIEVFVPVQMLLATGWVFSAWEVVPVIIWCGFFVCFPMFNSQGLRAGDLVAGTLVVAVPMTALPPELTDRGHGHVFTAVQLRAYGEHELHVLESILRQPPGAASAELRQMVARRIQAKIAWHGRVDNIDAFLKDFYIAQRAHLEHRRQFGQERKNKHDPV